MNIFGNSMYGGEVVNRLHILLPKYINIKFRCA